MKLFFARLKHWTWQIAVKGPLALVYISLISDGARLLISDLGRKLYKLPFLGFLQDYEGWHKLDCAHLFALGLLLAVFVTWNNLIHSWLQVHDDQKSGCNQRNYQRIVTVLAVFVLSIDAIFFYRAVVAEEWDSSLLSVTGLIATVAYIVVQVFVSFVSVTLKQEVKALSPKENDHDSAHDSASGFAPDGCRLRPAARPGTDFHLVRDAGREGR
jgi:hypothetical protein